MKMFRKANATLVFLLLGFLMVCSNAFALDTKWYIGLGWGASEIDSGVSNLTGTATLDDNDDGFKVFGGYRFNDYVGLEAFYVDFGEASLKGNNGDTFVYEGTTYQFIVNNASITQEVASYGVGVVLCLPLGKIAQNDILDRVTLFVKGGAHHWDSDVSVTASGLDRATADDDDFDFYYGVGVNIDLHKHLAIRAEYELYDLDPGTDSFGDDINYVSGSIVIKF